MIDLGNYVLLFST